jgi:hypothetical protein
MWIVENGQHHDTQRRFHDLTHGDDIVVLREYLRCGSTPIVIKLQQLQVRRASRLNQHGPACTCSNTAAFLWGHLPSQCLLSIVCGKNIRGVHLGIFVRSEGTKQCTCAVVSRAG